MKTHEVSNALQINKESHFFCVRTSRALFVSLSIAPTLFVKVTLPPVYPCTHGDTHCSSQGVQPVAASSWATPRIGSSVVAHDVPSFLRPAPSRQWQRISVGQSGSLPTSERRCGAVHEVGRLWTLQPPAHRPRRVRSRRPCRTSQPPASDPVISAADDAPDENPRIVPYM